MNFIILFFKSLAKQVSFAFGSSAKNLAIAIQQVVLPYLMFLIGTNAPYKPYEAGLIMMIPVLFWFISALLRAYSQYINKGPGVPTPAKRFTEVAEDGEVSVETGRLQEMLLYMADLEDYLERKSLI